METFKSTWQEMWPRALAGDEKAAAVLDQILAAEAKMMGLSP